MSDKEDLPKWPESLPIPDRIETAVMHVLEAEDLQSDDDVRELVSLMYAHHEQEFYLFLEQGTPVNQTILERLKALGVLAGASEFYYYKQPNFDRHYIRIHQHKIKFDWENEVVEKGPMFFRTALKLSQAMTRSLAIQEQIATQKAQDVNPLELKPNFFGIGIDLSKVWRWAVGWFRKARQDRP